MSIDNTISLATVSEIIGKVWAELEDGTSRLLQAGDMVYEGEVIHTEDGGQVLLRTASGAELRVIGGKSVVLSARLFAPARTLSDTDIAGLVAETGSDAPPVGQETSDSPEPPVVIDNNPQSGNRLHGFVRVERAVESVNTPPYLLWGYTGKYNASTSRRSAGYSLLLEGRATFDERLVIPVEPVTFAEVEPMVPLAPIAMTYSSSSFDDVPKNNTAEVTVSVQEDALPGGNRDTLEDTTVAKGSLAPLIDTGDDVPVTFSLQTTGLDAFGWTSNGVPLSFTVSGNTLTASVPSGPVFTLVLDPSTGAFTFTLSAPFDHLPGSGEEGTMTLDLSSAIVVTDKDGDAITVDNGFTIVVENDVPIGVGGPPGRVDEDELPFGITDGDGVTTVARGNISSFFYPGADQPLTYGLLTNTGGLPQELKSAGDLVTYVVTGNTLTATAGGRTVFTLVLDPATGDYTFTLSDRLDHPQANGDDNEILPLDLTSILQATDSDGDHSDSAGTFTINVEDDVPVGNGEVKGSVDEDELVPHGITDNDGVTTVNTGSIVSLFLIGADQPGRYGLSTNTGGLRQDLTSAGVKVTYSVTDNILTASAGSTPVFKLEIDPVTGAYTFTLLAQLDHPDKDGNDNETLSLDLASVLKVTDRDGDPLITSGTFTIKIEDDVPIGSGEVKGSVDEDELVPDGITDNDGVTTVATGTVSELFAVGADQPGIYGLSTDTGGLRQDLTSAGVSVTYSVNGNILTASAGNTPVFTLEIEPTTGAYTFTLLAQLDHPFANGDDNETLSLDLASILMVTDRDGDPLITSGTFTIIIEDDVPVATTKLERGAVQEDALPLGNREGVAQTTIAKGSIEDLFEFGADQPGSYGLSTNTGSLPQDLRSAGVLVTYLVTGNILTASAGSTPVFTLEIDPVTGDYKFELLAQLDHPLANGDDSETLSLDLTGILKATDRDGDPLTLSADGRFTIDVEDDVPIISNPVVGSVDEDDLPGGNSDNDNEGSIVTGDLSGIVASIGADQPGSFTFDLSSDTSRLPGLKSGGEPVSYQVIDTDSSGHGDTLIGFVNNDGAPGYNEPTDRPVFRLFIESITGKYTFTLLDQLDHPVPGPGDAGDDQILSIDFTSILDVHDRDRDPLGNLSANSFVIEVEDDIPVQTIATVTGSVQEDALSGGNLDTAADTTIATGTISGLVSVGADAPATYSVKASGLPTLFSNGNAVTYSAVDTNGDTITDKLVATASGSTVFTLELNQTSGAYTFTLLDQLDHPVSNSNDDEIMTLDLSGGLVATDKDGDAITIDTGSLLIEVEDDIPVQTIATVTGSVQEDALSGGNLDTAADTTIATGTISGLVSVGADAPATYSVKASGLPTLFSNGNAVTYSAVDTNGDTITDKLVATASGSTVFTLELNQTSGAYTFTLLDQLDHPVSNSNDDEIMTLDLSGGLVATDKDGDAITIDTGSLLIEVEDDIPITGTAAINASVVENGTAFNSASTSDLSDNLLDNDQAGSDVPASVTSFTLNGFTTHYPTGSPGTKTLYGMLVVNGDGSWSYTPDHDVFHRFGTTNLSSVQEEFTYYITDADGDTASATQTILVQDTNPRIGAISPRTLEEKNLPNGSSPLVPVTATESLKVQVNPDGIFDTYFLDDTVAPFDEPNNRSLTSDGLPVTYFHVDDSHTIIACTGTNPDIVANRVFTITINNPGSDTTNDATYTFTLLKPLDHNPLLNFVTDTNPADGILEITLPFNVETVDGDGDKFRTSFNVTVLDDSLHPTSFALKEDELDVSKRTMTINADAKNLSIVSGSGPVHGTVQLNAAAGTITYNPSSNYSGTDNFTYRYTSSENGSTVTQAVNVTVTPVSDAPELTVDDPTLSTEEDTQIVLGLFAPTVGDATDQNGIGTAGDDPERLGAITISGIPVGAKIFKADGTTLVFEATTGSTSFTVMLVQTIGGMVLITGNDSKPLFVEGTTADEYLTVSEYEGLKLLPPPNSGNNFSPDINVSVTEYEVDEFGVRKEVSSGVPVPGVTTTATIAVEVLAVTDIPIDLKIDSLDAPYTATFNEDTVFDLGALLSATPFDDILDGSEGRSIKLSGFPEEAIGSLVTYTTNASPVSVQIVSILDSITIPLINGSGGIKNVLPGITITPLPNFSGDMNGITVTLQAQDIDPETTSTLLQTDSVTLNLHVSPVADDIAAPDVSTPEDTGVKFMLGLVPTDTSTDPLNGGREVITGITIKAFPAGWKLYDEAGVLLTTVSGSDYTVDPSDITTVHLNTLGDPDGFNYQYYTILPPAHSSADLPALGLEVTSTDTSDPDGDGVANVVDTKTVTHNIKVTVTPMGENIGTDSNDDGQTDIPLVPTVADTDGNSTADLRMNPSHDYGVVTAKEDEWFKLHRVGIAGDPDDFDLKTPWSNEDTTTLSYQDNSEKTYALFTPQDSLDNDLTDSWFKYNDGSADQIRKYSGTPIEVPVEFLDTLEFKPPAHVAADNIKIIVNAKTVDTDQDSGGTVDTRITGKVVLTLDVESVPDQVTLAAYSPGGYEDGSPSALNPSPATPALAIPLYINPQSDDNTDGASIVYGALPPLTIIAGSVTIPDFDSSLTLGIIPPANSDSDISLKVTGTSTDGLSAPVPFGYTLNLPVQVSGVADTAMLTAAEPTFVENSVDDDHNRIRLTSAITGSSMVDGDLSETLTVKITNLDGRFDIEGATYLSGDGTGRIWVVRATDLSGVNIIVPIHFSGDITFTGTPVTSELEGSVLTGTPPQNFTIHVTPSPESAMVLDTELNEDELKLVVFDIIPGPVAHPDTDEVLMKVYLKVGGAGVLDGVEAREFTLYYGAAGIKTLAQAVSDNDIRIVTISTPGGTVDAYELDGAVDYDNIYVRYAADTDGVSTFKASYEINDPATATSFICCNDYTLTVNAVTDTIGGSDGPIDPLTDDNHTVTVNPATGYQTVEATGYTTFTVPVTVTQSDQVSEGPNGADIDGSEKLLKFVIDGVPQGVSVEGAVYAGDVWDSGAYVHSGRWILYDDRVFTTTIPDLTKNIVFNVDGTAEELKGVDKEITITAYSQDMGTDSSLASLVVVSAPTKFKLTTPLLAEDFDEDGRPTDLPPTVDNWTIDPAYVPVEDTSAPLSMFFRSGPDAPTVSGPGAFTVTLSGLPAGSVVAAASGSVYRVDQFTQGGETVYSISGSGGTAGLTDLLSEVTLKTPPDDNSNNSAPIDLVMTITTYVAGSNQANAVAVSTPLVVTPVTDPMAITITAPSVDEDNSEIFTITFSNSADNQPGYSNPAIMDFTGVVAMTLYLSLDTSAMTPPSGGKLFYMGAEITTTTFGTEPATGVPAGTYYVITSVDDADTLSFTYTPEAHASGAVEVTAYALNQETDSTLEVTNSQTATFNVTPVNDPYGITAVTASGIEDDTRIRLMIAATGLIDRDGSETVVSALLENVPDGYLVYSGDDDISAVLALNVGAAGTGNTWAIPLDSGALPDYIAVKPPQHVSGELSGMALTVYSGESDLTELSKTSVAFTLMVAPVADPINPDFFQPTKTFGKEGLHIPLNLNLILDDQDGSETATLTFTGLGEYAAFYKADGSLLDSTHVSYAAGVYTLTGIPAYDPLEQYDVNNLFVVQSARTGTVTVTAYTVDTASGYFGTYDSSVATRTSTFTLDIARVVPTGGADTLLYDGTTLPARSYDGLVGEDTLVLRKGEGITFDPTTTARLRNIENIDLSVTGINAVSSLEASDVLAVTDSDAKLYILGSTGDSVELGSTLGLLSSGNETVNGNTYSMGKYTDGSATVYVQNGVTVTHLP